jgi:hypothetical protein
MQWAESTSECLPTQRVRGVSSPVEPPKKGEGNAKAGGGGDGGGSFSNPKAAASSGEAAPSAQQEGEEAAAQGTEEALGVV